MLTKDQETVHFGDDPDSLRPQIQGDLIIKQPAMLCNFVLLLLLCSY